MPHPDWTRLFKTKTKILPRGDSWRLEFDDRIVPDSPNPGWEQHTGSTTARYKCSECGRTWPSMQVLVVFHMYLTRRRGIVKVRPFRQNCKICKDAPMEMPSVTYARINVLMRNLVEEIRIKCYHIELERRDRPFRAVDINSPHEPSHCEACQQGICKAYVT